MSLSDTTNADLLDYLVETSDVPTASKVSYAAGYFEGVLLTLMDQDPKVREHIEQRVRYRMNERGDTNVDNGENL